MTFFSTTLAPKLLAASKAPPYGHLDSSPFLPRVISTPLEPNTLAARMGAMQQRAIGMPEEHEVENKVGSELSSTNN